MDFQLNEFQRALEASVRDFVDREVIPVASDFEHRDAYPHPLVDRMKELGYFGAIIPEENGGAGMGALSYAVLTEELARGWMSLTGVIGSHSMVSWMVSEFGSGEQRREYMHVSDMANAYDLVLQRSDLAGATLNVGTGDTPSVKEIARTISDRMGVSIVNEPARSGEVSGFELDSSKIRQLGFTPHVKFWDGLSAYLAGRDAVPIDSAH